MIMYIQNLIKFCPFILKIWSKHQILESIKGRNSVANLRKTMIYNTNIDLVNDDVCIYIYIQDLVSFCQFVIKTLSKKQILTSIKGRKPVANLQKTMIYITNVDLVNDNELHKVWSHFVNSFSRY